jgi:hypothetical protein
MLYSLSISQFEASEKLTGLAFGLSYQKASFSTLLNHVKDNAILLDQTERLLQTATCRAHEANVKAKDGKPPLAASSTGTPSDPKVFLGRDGKEHAYLIPPDAFKKMTQAERKAELTRLKAARGYQVNEHTATTVVSANTGPTSSLPASAGGIPIAMNISYSGTVNSGANPSVSSNLCPTPSVMSHQSGYPGTSPVPPQSMGQQSAGGTNNLIRQILSSNQSVPPAVTAGTQHTQDSFINIDGRVYHQVNSHTVQYDLSRHGTSLPLSSLMDGGANGGITGSDARIISSSDFQRAHVTGIGESTIAELPLVTAAGFVQTRWGPAIVFMQQYAGYGKGHTIHSSAQIRAFSTQVHDTPRSQGGQQRIITSEGYHIPFPTALAFLIWTCAHPLTKNCGSFLTSFLPLMLHGTLLLLMMNYPGRRSLRMHPLMPLLSILTLVSMRLGSTLAIFKMTLT